MCGMSGDTYEQAWIHTQHRMTCFLITVSHIRNIKNSFVQQLALPKQYIPFIQHCHNRAGIWANALWYRCASDSFTRVQGGSHSDSEKKFIFAYDVVVCGCSMTLDNDDTYHECKHVEMHRHTNDT